MSRRTPAGKASTILLVAALLVLGSCRENPLMGKITDLVEANGKRVVSPTFDSTPGTYYLPPLSVSISTETAEADIYYTIDGSDPIPGGSSLFVALSPLSITRSVTVRAVAAKKYWEDSMVAIAEYTIPFSVEQRKLQAPDHAGGDWFGDAVAASDQYLVVGAYRKDEGSIDQAGVAYIFEKALDGWDDGTKVTAGSDADAGDWFGDSVAVSGDYVVVGAIYDEGDSIPPSNTGAAYIFYKETSSWDSSCKIIASSGQSGDEFGQTVAISDNWLIVGALGDDDPLSNSGAAYIFERTGPNSWDQRLKLKAGAPMVDAYYGLSVSIDGDYAVVGAPNETVSGKSKAGAAYVYYYDSVSKTWGSEMRLTATSPTANAQFGYSVAISGDYIIVGAPAAIDGTVAEAAYVYHRTSTFVWDVDVANLIAPDGQPGDDFAVSVDINSEFSVVGARFGGAAAINSGSAYVFHRAGANTWNEGFEILPSDGQVDDYFGYFVGLTEDVLIVGAHHEDSGGDDTGSAYVFK